jgi:hypothetical protein
MNKIKYIWTIVKDRWLRPYDEITVRFNTKAESGDTLVWRVFINGVEHLASGFEIHGYVYDIVNQHNGETKWNVGCKGRVRWEGSKAVIITAPKQQEDLLA